MSVNPIYEFSPGLLRRDEYGGLLESLSHHLELREPMAIIMSLGDDLDDELVSHLGVEAHDYDSFPQGILAFPRGEHFVRDFWRLLELAEPEFIFNFEGSFTELKARLWTDYFLPALRKSSPLPHGSPSASTSTGSNTFIVNFGPIIRQVSGLFFLLVNQPGVER